MEYIQAKTIVTRTKNSSWFGTSFNMNLYKGCCHGCIYCDSRSDCYGIDAFDQVRAKKDALRIVRDELRRKSTTGVVATGSMSDPYNPYEKELKLTRHALELLDAFGFGVAVATKSDLIVRDADIFCNIKEHSPVVCKITVTACDDSLSQKIEPHAPPSSKRFAAIAELAGRGIFSGVLLMPVLPFLEDTPENILGIVRMAHESGARFVYPAFGMTCRQNQREYYLKKLDELFPQENLSQQYRRRYGNRYECPSPRARELWELFCAECRRTGILYQMGDIIRASRQGYGDGQLSFL